MSSLGGHAPAFGGRVELRLVRLSATHAHYEALLGEPEKQWRCAVDVELTAGAVGWHEASEPAPQWLHAFAEALLRGAWRARDNQPWPRRITRWRSAKGAD
jgi:hypothetical protein